MDLNWVTCPPKDDCNCKLVLKKESWIELQSSSYFTFAHSSANIPTKNLCCFSHVWAEFKPFSFWLLIIISAVLWRAAFSSWVTDLKLVLFSQQVETSCRFYLSRSEGLFLPPLVHCEHFLPAFISRFYPGGWLNFLHESHVLFILEFFAFSLNHLKKKLLHSQSSCTNISSTFQKKL